MDKRLNCCSARWLAGPSGSGPDAWLATPTCRSTETFHSVSHIIKNGAKENREDSPSSARHCAPAVSPHQASSLLPA